MEREKQTDRHYIKRAVRDRICLLRITWIQSPYPDTDSESGLLANFNGDFLVQGYICDKIFMKIQLLSPLSRYIIQTAENALSRNVEESFTKNS